MIMAWIEQVDNEIWTCDSFLRDSTVDTILKNMRNSTSKNLHRTDMMRQTLAEIGVNNNSYDYVIYQYDIRKDLDIIGEIADRLDEILLRYDESAPRQKFNAMQCFVKSFGPDSHYDVHVESYEKYGHWAWIHFLSDEESGELIFPDKTQLDKHLAENPIQVKTWEDNVELLRSFGEETRYVGPYSIKPKRNTCIFFRTGSAHWVSPMLNHNDMTRPTATGWPHASQRMLEDLNRNCRINENFGNK